jgi:hypothetical protein
VQTEALLESSRRAEELQYVTQHFRDLQGLVWAPSWAALLAFAVVADIAHCSAIWAKWTAYLAALTLCLPGIEIPFVRDWYEQRNGSVTTVDPSPPISPSPVLSILHPDIHPRRPAPQRPALPIGLLLVGALVAGFFLPRACVAYAVPVSVVVIALNRKMQRALYRSPSVPAIRLRQAIYAAAVVVVLLGSRTSAHLALRPLAGWRGMELFAAILLLANLYDHWLLGHLLGPRKEVVHE